MTAPQDSASLREKIERFDDFLNEPMRQDPPEKSEVREYRFAAYRRWEMLRMTILAAIESANREGAVPAAEVDANQVLKWSAPDYGGARIPGTKLYAAPPLDAAKDSQRIAALEEVLEIAETGQILATQESKELRQQLATLQEQYDALIAVNENVRKELDAAVKALIDGYEGATHVTSKLGATPCIKLYYSTDEQAECAFDRLVEQLDAAIDSSAKQSDDIEPLGGIQP